jgi:hypothetical protein
MIILITGDDTFCVQSTDTPVVGQRYNLEPADEGTNKQNRLFHPLIMEWYKSGAHSYGKVDYEKFRELIKRDYGAGFESFVYATPEGLKRATYIEEIPEQYRNSTYTAGRLKSWAKYTKKERKETIDRVISAMEQCGVNTKKFYEILEGIQK